MRIKPGEAQGQKESKSLKGGDETLQEACVGAGEWRWRRAERRETRGGQEAPRGKQNPKHLIDLWRRGDEGKSEGNVALTWVGATTTAFSSPWEDSEGKYIGEGRAAVRLSACRARGMSGRSVTTGGPIIERKFWTGGGEEDSGDEDNWNKVKVRPTSVDEKREIRSW
jgi:hypothetical protein